MTRKGKGKMPRSGGRSSILARFVVASPDTTTDFLIREWRIVAVFVLTGEIEARNGSRMRFPWGTLPL